MLLHCSLVPLSLRLQTSRLSSYRSVRPSIHVSVCPPNNAGRVYQRAQAEEEHEKQHHGVHIHVSAHFVPEDARENKGKTKSPESSGHPAAGTNHLAQHISLHAQPDPRDLLRHSFWSSSACSCERLTSRVYRNLIFDIQSDPISMAEPRSLSSIPRCPVLLLHLQRRSIIPAALLRAASRWTAYSRHVSVFCSSNFPLTRSFRYGADAAEATAHKSSIN